MERKKGYLDLSKELIKHSKKKQKDLVTTTRCSTDAFWIKNLNGKNYLFKVIEENSQKYRALIIEEMAKLANIPVPHTDLATLGYLRGELIEDYRKENFNYIPGSNILYEFFLAMKDTEYIQSIVPKYLMKDKLNEEELTELLKRLNNLETIWYALRFYYRKYTNKDEIVHNITSDLANRFAFDFLTMQRDRHASNWEVEENNTTASLAPHFDSNRSFYYPSFNLEFHIDDHYKSIHLYEELEYYLAYSDNLFCDYFFHLYELFTPNNIEEIINQVEKNINTTIPQNIKIEILDSYQKHYEKLNEIIKRRKHKK
ncbi:MAG: hypothetical protein HFI09_04165 [Bacilli bacterium]|nr:hypothetical protein [Bacilli bacterium]